jgi:hypothetical protein
MKKLSLFMGTLVGLVLMGCPIWCWFVMNYVVGQPAGSTMFSNLGDSATAVLLTTGLFSFPICGLGFMTMMSCFKRLKPQETLST